MKTKDEQSTHSKKPLIVNLTLIFVALISVGGAVALVWYSFVNASKIPPEVALLKDVFLFILSLIATLIVSHWYAKISNTEKVDTIAERSTEKMVLLTMQLEGLSSYLRETIVKANNEGVTGRHDQAALAYTHRIEGAINNIEQLARSNDAFRSDWLGVVSVEMRKKIQKQYSVLKDYFEAKSTLSENGQLKANEQMQLEKQLNQALRHLPTSAVSSPMEMGLPAIRVTQNFAADATEIAQSGQITFTVLRDIFKVTGTGKLTPKMTDKPFVKLQLVSMPPGLEPDLFRYTVGIGTNFDFNVFLKSDAYGKFLPKGNYVFTYSAEVSKFESKPTSYFQDEGT